MAEEKKPRCCYCGNLAEGRYSIHRDGFGEGPEIDLCDLCGGSRFPTCEEIWDALRESSRHE